jgi:NAD(P)-dependent dehydrogenase (short-subunit alcohol dehydrogenase family)
LPCHEGARAAHPFRALRGHGGKNSRLDVASAATIRPGPTKAEIHEPARLERITPLLPMGGPDEPQEIAETILFLLSDMASYISGATLNVSGAR